MSDIISQTSLPSDGERVALRTTLIERRHRLTALPPDAVGPQVAGLLTEIDAALDRLERAGFGACARCDGRVEHDRLLADPLTTVCLDCLTDPEAPRPGARPRARVPRAAVAAAAARLCGRRVERPLHLPAARSGRRRGG